MKGYVVEQERKTLINGKCDVFVAGGGMAGISAALAAARSGAKVILAEKQCILGGLATSGLVTFYLPICDGEGRQVSFGQVEELLRLSVKHGPHGHYPKAWLEGGNLEEKIGFRYETQFNAFLYAIELERLLVECGVKVLYDTRVCGVTMVNEKIQTVIVENKSGRTAYEVTSVVDATGDADIFQIVGANTEKHAIGNVLCAWNYGLKDGSIKINMMGWTDTPDKDGCGSKPLSKRLFSGLDGEEISEMLVLSHEQMLSKFLYENQIDETYTMNMIPTIPQLRMTRKIKGAYIMDAKEMHQKFEDSIGLVSDWRKPGPVYSIPFRSLFEESVRNLICAGRCISVTDSMWDITRSIPCCVVTGQAAGTAAAMSDDFFDMDVRELQTELISNGVVLHEAELP